MNILHVTLGLPPYRKGGLTKYATDLFTSQSDSGHAISLLFPGRSSLRSRMHIQRQKTYRGVEVFEIVNPLPVSLLGGVVSPVSFTKPCDIGVFTTFLSQHNFDLIHVHTLMGIHKEFFQAARALKIKMVFTSHDYFGLCPKVNLFDSDMTNCNDYQDGEKCFSCNSGAYSLTLISFMQSHTYRLFKDSPIMKRLRSFKAGLGSLNLSTGNRPAPRFSRYATEVVNLRRYYLDIFQMIDRFHFNSSMAMSVFSNYITLKGSVINIVHKDIKDNRQLKKNNPGKPVSFGYLGSWEDFKGLKTLLGALTLLHEKKVSDWSLDIYGCDSKPDQCSQLPIVFHGKYSYNQLKHIFEHIDVLVIPSLCRETFGFITLEALSHGVPVIIFDNIGSKDIVDYSNGIIIGSSVTELAECLTRVIGNKSILTDLNANIIDSDWFFSFENHTQKILAFYSDVLTGSNDQ
jgi:glycosyltransferase involved in cell wall biosynthesis